MTIRHLKIFVAVYRTGSMTKAAAQLFMTQPAVTRSIGELERYYGVRLFERIERRLSVTEAGKRLYTYAVHITDSFDRLEKGLRDWDELGILRVGASVTLGSMLLPRVLKTFRRTHTGLTVRSTVATGAELQEMLGHNELDLALIEGVVTDGNLVAEAFGEDRLILLLPPGSELISPGGPSLSELSEQPLLLRDKRSVSRQFIDHVFALHGLNAEPLMESISVHAIVQGVHEGLGISFLPERLVEHSVASGFVATCSVRDEAFVRKNYVVRHRNKLLSNAAQQFVALCREMNAGTEPQCGDGKTVPVPVSPL